MPVPFPHLHGIERIVVLTQPAPHDFVLTGFGRVAVVHRGGVSVFDEETGRLLFFTDAGDSRSFPSLTSVGVFFGLSEFDAQGKRTPRECLSAGDMLGRNWAMRVTGDWVSYVSQLPRTGNHESIVQDSVTVGIEQLSADGGFHGQVAQGAELAKTFGMGAVFDDGGLIVATRDKRLLDYVLPEKREGLTDWLPQRTTHLQFAPYDISLPDGHIALLEALNPTAAVQPYSGQEELALVDNVESASWSTRLHILSRTGQELSHATVSFPVLQPPVEQAHNQVFLAGLGFAAVRGNQVLYSHRATHRCFATAGLGGDVALVNGSQLQLVALDGTIRQTLSTPDGEVITTPPALAANGAIWFATNNALYVAR